MSQNGLQPVKDTSTMFLSNQEFAGDASTGLTVMLEGTRPMMVEVQALCVRSQHVRPCLQQVSGFVLVLSLSLFFSFHLRAALPP